MNVMAKIECPDCGKIIHVDAVLLISGASFKCSNKNCSVSLSLDNGQATVVAEAFEKFSEIKRESTSMSGNSVYDS